MSTNIDFDRRNKMIVDWVSFTCYMHPTALIEQLGLSQLTFTTVPGAKGFRNRLYFDGISIHYDFGRNGPEYRDLIWLEMSGQGCRVFETFSECNDFDSLLFWVISTPGVKLTRLDVAYDDIEDEVLDIRTMAKDTLDGFYVSKSRYYEVIQSSKGTSLVFGSPQSEYRVRIYDKAAERGFPPEVHWVRVEQQMRRERAVEFVRQMSALNLGQVFTGVLVNYLWFAERTKDTNKSRWKMADYWSRFIGEVDKISLFVKPGVDYNLEKCKDYVYNQAGNAVNALIQILGYQTFVDELGQRKIKQSKKYQDLIDEHNGWIEL